MRSKKDKRKANTGIKRIEHELEIDRFLKTQIKMRIALEVLFTKAERFLINKNKAFVITSEDSADPKPCKNSKSHRFQENDIKTLGPHFDELFEGTGLQLDPVSQPTRKVALSFRRKYDGF